VLITGWINKENLSYIQDEKLFSLKIEENPIICNNMDGPEVYYSKWNCYAQKDAYWMISLIDGIWKCWIHKKRE
jgi:hypothetical protein